MHRGQSTMRVAQIIGEEVLQCRVHRIDNNRRILNAEEHFSGKDERSAGPVHVGVLERNVDGVAGIGIRVKSVDEELPAFAESGLLTEFRLDRGSRILAARDNEFLAVPVVHGLRSRRICRPIIGTHAEYAACESARIFSLGVLKNRKIDFGGVGLITVGEGNAYCVGPAELTVAESAVVSAVFL